MTAAWIPDDLEAGEPVLVSACVAGFSVRYRGDAKPEADLIDGLKRAGAIVIPVCPELLGGLPVPRPPAEPKQGTGREVWRGESEIFDDQGRNVTESFRKGAEAAVSIARKMKVRYAFLMERSPSCGVERTHSNGRVVEGSGVTTVALREADVSVHPVDPGTSGDS